MTSKTLMMDITRPDGSTETYGQYDADQITAYCERIRVEHQLSQTKRALREPTEEEKLKYLVQPEIFRLK